MVSSIIPNWKEYGEGEVKTFVRPRTRYVSHVSVCSFRFRGKRAYTYTHTHARVHTRSNEALPHHGSRNILRVVRTHFHHLNEVARRDKFLVNYPVLCTHTSVNAVQCIHVYISSIFYREEHGRIVGRKRTRGSLKVKGRRKRGGPEHKAGKRER